MDGRQAVAALNREWRDLAHIPVSWGREEPVLADASDPEGARALVRGRADEVLAALLRLGSRGDPLGHRVVLQALLGRVVRLCARRPDLLPDAVSELWVAIVEYPLDRRPRSIANNLAWTVHRRLPRPLPGPRAHLDPVAVPADLDATRTLADARSLGLIDGHTHRTLWLVYVAGLSSTQAAARLGTSPEAVRWRCSWALRRLARHAVLLAA